MYAGSQTVILTKRTGTQKSGGGVEAGLYVLADDLTFTKSFDKTEAPICVLV